MTSWRRPAGEAETFRRLAPGTCLPEATCGIAAQCTSRTCRLPRCTRRRRRCRPLLQLPAASEAVHRRCHGGAERRAAADLQQHKGADGQQDAGIGRGRQDLAAPAEQHAGDEQAEGDLRRRGEQRAGWSLGEGGQLSTVLQRNRPPPGRCASSSAPRASHLGQHGRRVAGDHLGAQQPAHQAADQGEPAGAGQPRRAGAQADGGAGAHRAAPEAAAGGHRAAATPSLT